MNQNRSLQGIKQIDSYIGKHAHVKRIISITARETILRYSFRAGATSASQTEQKPYISMRQDRVRERSPLTRTCVPLGCTKPFSLCRSSSFFLSPSLHEAGRDVHGTCPFSPLLISSAASETPLSCPVATSFCQRYKLEQRGRLLEKKLLTKGCTAAPIATIRTPNRPSFCTE